MLHDYILIAAVTATVALTWRMLLLDHPRLLAFILRLPIIGGALSCGFCVSMWLALAATLLADPLVSWRPHDPLLITILLHWFALAAGVLFVRNAIAVLLEGNGVLTEMHLRSHR